MNRTYKPFYWLNEASRLFLSRGYIPEGQTAEERIRFIGDTAEKILGIEGYSDKFYDYMSRGWFSLSSPIWANFGLPKGLPIACNSSYVDDSMDGIAFATSEQMMLTKYGAGTSSYWGAVRPRGSEIKDNGTADGAVNFMRLFDVAVDVSKQGSTRRGAHAVYLPITHGDIEEFLEIKSEGNPIQNLSFGVTIPPGWMRSMVDGDKQKRKLWAKVLEKRKNLGYPYIFFEDNVNNNTVDVYKDKKMYITNSNLCIEVCLPVTKDETFVCDLMSMNLLHFDEWKDTDAVEVAVMLLDAVMSEYIEKTEELPFFKRANQFAKRHRALNPSAH